MFVEETTLSEFLRFLHNEGIDVERDSVRALRTSIAFSLPSEFNVTD